MPSSKPFNVAVSRRLEPEEWPVYRDFSLEMLGRDPASFSQNSVDMIRGTTDAQWQDMMAICYLTKDTIDPDRSIIEQQKEADNKNSRATIVYVLENQGAQAGFVAAKASDHFPDALYWSSIYLRPEYRGQGMAQKLVYSIMALALIRRFENIIVAHRDGNAPLEKLARRMGFEPEAIDYRDLLWADGGTANRIRQKLVAPQNRLRV